MNKGFLALALSLSILPISALADDSATTPPAPTAEQRQAMHQAVDQFAKQEEQLHQQMRQQVLSSMTSSHLQAIATAIGQLAIAPSPDPEAAAKQIDAMLSPGEQQQIVAAHQSFVSQSMQLHRQLMTQMQSMMPAHPPMNGNRPHAVASMPHDAGMLVLAVLSPHPMMGEMGMHGMGMMMDGMGPAGPMPPAAPPQP